jgi:hypothetical protein
VYRRSVGGTYSNLELQEPEVVHRKVSFSYTAGIDSVIDGTTATTAAAAAAAVREASTQQLQVELHRRGSAVSAIGSQVCSLVVLYAIQCTWRTHYTAVLPVNIGRLLGIVLMQHVMAQMIIVCSAADNIVIFSAVVVVDTV